MTPSFDQPERGRTARGTVLLRSSLDGAWIGAAAGIAYGIVIGLGASAGVAAPTALGFAGLAAVVSMGAVPVGVVLGTVFGAVFGLVAWTGIRRLAWLEVAVVAVFGGLVLALAIIGSGQVNSGFLAFSTGPLVAGVPAAALHGWRAQRRAA